MFISMTETSRGRLPAWKTNSLATIAYGADERIRKQFRAPCLTDTLEKAGRINVHMHDAADGVELTIWDPIPESASKARLLTHSAKPSDATTLVSTSPALPPFDFQVAQEKAGKTRLSRWNSRMYKQLSGECLEDEGEQDIGSLPSSPFAPANSSSQAGSEM